MFDGDNSIWGEIDKDWKEEMMQYINKTKPNPDLPVNPSLRLRMLASGDVAAADDVISTDWTSADSAPTGSTTPTFDAGDDGNQVDNAAAEVETIEQIEGTTAEAEAKADADLVDNKISTED